MATASNSNENFIGENELTHPSLGEDFDLNSILSEKTIVGVASNTNPGEIAKTLHSAGTCH